MPRAFTPEFALLLACCRWPTPRAAIRDAAGAPIDWARFGRLAARHRVEGIVWRALKDADVAAPADTGAALSTAAAGIAAQNMRLAAEAVQLNRLMEARGLAPLFVKGIALGKLAYGDIARKAGWDIDLLVRLDELAAAAASLAERGYTLTLPETADAEADLPVWHLHSKESVWRSADGTIWVELHTALTDNPHLLLAIAGPSARRDVEISPGLTLPTLGHDELVAYLCVHGASSAWFRLKWIADLAALLGSATPGELDRLYRRSQDLGAGRAAAQGFLLASALFAIPLSDELRQELAASRINRWLVAIALRKLTGRGGERELDDVVLGTASIHLSQLALLPGWRFKRTALSRLLVSPIDRVRTPLPAMLRWLYPMLQGVRLARERIGR